MAMIQNEANNKNQFIKAFRQGYCIKSAQQEWPFLVILTVLKTYHFFHAHVSIYNQHVVSSLVVSFHASEWSVLCVCVCVV